MSLYFLLSKWTDLQLYTSLALRLYVINCKKIIYGRIDLYRISDLNILVVKFIYGKRYDK